MKKATEKTEKPWTCWMPVDVIDLLRRESARTGMKIKALVVAAIRAKYGKVS